MLLAELDAANSRRQHDAEHRHGVDRGLRRIHDRRTVRQIYFQHCFFNVSRYSSASCRLVACFRRDDDGLIGFAMCRF
jgi:hypothetical protein